MLKKCMNTIFWVKSINDLLNHIDEYKITTIPYGKIFVVFDKDNFNSDTFDEAVSMCEKNGYIPFFKKFIFHIYLYHVF